MKKQYTNPTVEVVYIEGADIVTNSPMGFGGEDEGNQTVQSKRRNIWEDE